MQLSGLFINIVLIFALNVLFFFSGVCLNSLVVLCFWRTEQLRKKLCYFMIMVLSSFDLIAVLTNHSLGAFLAIYWFKTGMMITDEWARITRMVANILLAFPCVALVVMNFDRYLATYHPLFHRTSVTKGKLSIPLAVLSIGFTTLTCATEYNFIVSFPIFLLSCLFVFLLPMVFFNYKLFIIARKSRKNKEKLSEIKRTFSLKKISSCLLSTACFTVFSIPMFIFICFFLTSTSEDKVFLAALWVRTISSMNATFNCLIFFWKNKILRAEGMKVLRGLKVCRRHQP